MLLLLFINLLYLLSIKVECFTGIFWDVCDLHLNISQPTNINGGFGNNKQDSSIGLIESAFIEMKRIYPDPDFIIINGDNVYHGNIGFIEPMQNISDTLYKVFPNTTVIPTLGNHDVLPRNELPLHSNSCETFFTIWKDYFRKIDKNETETFKRGCFYSLEITSDKGKVNIIALNTMLWYERNKHVSNLTDPEDQFVWLKDKLEKSRISGYKVFLVGHAPPGISEYSTVTIKHLYPQYNEKLKKILVSYSDIIQAGFFAHQHTDAFKIVSDSNDKPIVPIFQCPSITPFRLRQIGSVNPSIRLYHWNESNDNSYYEQYHTIIPISIDGLNVPILNWSLEYNSKSLINGLSANNLNKLLEDFKSANSIYFDTFFKYHLSGQPHEDMATCPLKSECRCRFICGMGSIDHTKVDNCLNTCPNGGNPNSRILIIVLVSIFGSLLIVGLIIIIIYKIYNKKRALNKQNNNPEITTM